MLRLETAAAARATLPRIIRKLLNFRIWGFAATQLAKRLYSREAASRKEAPWTAPRGSA